MNSRNSSGINSVCVVGVGLIGGSFAQALKRSGFTGTITGVVRDQEKGSEAVRLGVVDKATCDIVEAARFADIIMLSVPMLSMRGPLEKIAPVIQPHTIVTDAGSVKNPFIADAKACLPYINRVVPGHPIAGKEKSGLAAVDPNLYQNHRILLTPLPETDADAVQHVRVLWEQTGGIVETLTPDHHDAALAATSHLPHVLAFAMVDMLASRQEINEIFRYSAGGFRDFTRIASGETIMWRDICLTNKESVCQAIGEFEAHLSAIKTAIVNDDAQTLETVFRRAREARDRHIGPNTKT